MNTVSSTNTKLKTSDYSHIPTNPNTTLLTSLIAGQNLSMVSDDNISIDTIWETFVSKNTTVPIFITEEPIGLSRHIYTRNVSGIGNITTEDNKIKQANTVLFPLISSDNNMLEIVPTEETTTLTSKQLTSIDKCITIQETKESIILNFVPDKCFYNTYVYAYKMYKILLDGETWDIDGEYTNEYIFSRTHLNTEINFHSKPTISTHDSNNKCIIDGVLGEYENKRITTIATDINKGYFLIQLSTDRQDIADLLEPTTGELLSDKIFKTPSAATIALFDSLEIPTEFPTS